MSNVIFVFGSNLAGRHGKGAAKHAALHFGAQYGIGRGRTGNAYALPTKDERLEVRTEQEVKRDIDMFLEYAASMPDHHFIVTAVGTGLAGFDPYDIACMFGNDIPENVYISGKLWEHKS